MTLKELRTKLLFWVVCSCVAVSFGQEGDDVIDIRPIGYTEKEDAKSYQDRNSALNDDSIIVPFAIIEEVPVFPGCEGHLLPSVAV